MTSSGLVVAVDCNMEVLVPLSCPTGRVSDPAPIRVANVAVVKGASIAEEAGISCPYEEEDMTVVAGESDDAFE